MADKAAKKQRGRPFPKGVSGNPHGCARGSRHKASLLAERLMEGDAEEVVRAVVTAAKNGDMTAARIIIERLLPPKKDRPVSFALPGIASAGDAAKAMGALLAAVAAGNVTPSEAGELSKIVDAYVEALQVSEFEQRLKALEERADAAYATF